MAEGDEKQTEATDGGTNPDEEKESSKEKKPKKSRKAAKEADDSTDKEKPKKSYPRYADAPKIHDMIIEALDVLDTRKGVTLPAIKSYLEDNYHVDITKQAAHIRKLLIKAVEDGDIVRTRGTGCSGRFKVKHTKPTMIKKRRAPEDYQELPNPPRVNKPRPKPPARKEASEAPKKAAATAKKASTPAKSATKGKKGRFGRKK